MCNETCSTFDIGINLLTEQLAKREQLQRPLSRITYDAIPIISRLVPQGFEAWIVTSSAPVDAMTAPSTIETRIRVNRLLAAKNLGASSSMPFPIAKTAARVAPDGPRTSLSWPSVSPRSSEGKSAIQARTKTV